MVLRAMLPGRSGGWHRSPRRHPRAGSSLRPAGRARSTKLDVLSTSVFPVSTLCLVEHISGVLFLFQRIVSCVDR